MTRAEFIESCRSLTEDRLREVALELRQRAGSRIPPQVAAQFRNLDGVTAVEELFPETAWGRSHVYLVRKTAPASETPPVLVNVHGGGWCLEHTERDLYFCRRMAVATGCLVVDVDYVLAPEHPYPAAIEEIGALLEKLPELAAAWGGDPERVILCGQSAGGNLLGAVMQRKKSVQGLRILSQILCYLPADNYHDHFNGRELDERGKSTEYYGFFYNRDFDERKNHDVSLALSSPEELAGLPPTDIVTAGLDDLCPEGRRYYELLKDSGVPSSYRCFENSRHGFLVNLYDQWREGEAFVAGLILRRLKN